MAWQFGQVFEGMPGLRQAFVPQPVMGKTAAELRQIYIEEKGVLLQPANSHYKPEMVTYPDEVEILGKVIWDEMPNSRGSTFYKQFTKAMQEQRPVSFEEYYEPLDMWAGVHALPSPSGLSVSRSPMGVPRG